MAKSKKPKLIQKVCTCCGGFAGKSVQWPNQDTGTGLCASCVAWIKGRNPHMTEEEFEFTYGKEGVHYPAPEAS